MRRASIMIRPGPAWYCASSSVSAASALAVTMRCGAVEHGRRLEAVAVDADRREGSAHVEVVGERERQPEEAGEPGAVIRRPQQDDLRRSRQTGVARKRFQRPSAPRMSPSSPITSIR